MALNSKGPKNIRWCPWCGLDRLDRDAYASFRQHKLEYICRSCGAAFRILDSTRKQDVNRMMAHERRQRVPTPTNAATTELQAKERFAAICKRKFKEFKHARHLEVTRAVGEDMRVWLESEEAKQLRGGKLG